MSGDGNWASPRRAREIGSNPGRMELNNNTKKNEGDCINEEEEEEEEEKKKRE